MARTTHPTLNYPQMDGIRYDASCIELKLNAKRYIGCTECTYKQTVEPGIIRGVGPQPVGFTRGDYIVTGTLVMLREEFQELVADLETQSLGILEPSFSVSITYHTRPISTGFSHFAEAFSDFLPSWSGDVANVLDDWLTGDTSADFVGGMRVLGTEHRFAAGSADPIRVEMPFIAQYLLVDGRAPLNNLVRTAYMAQ